MPLTSDQVIVGWTAMVCPNWSKEEATNCWVPPGRKVTDGGLIVMVVTV